MIEAMNIQGLGLSTAAQIEHQIDQLRSERDALTLEVVTARRDRETMQATLNASPATVDHPMVTMFQRMVEQMIAKAIPEPFDQDDVAQAVSDYVDLGKLDYAISSAVDDALCDLKFEVSTIEIEVTR